MKYTLLIFTCMISLVLTTSCKDTSSTNSKKKSKFHDIVHNPTTADKNKAPEDVPRLNAPETEFIFGKIKQGEIVSHKFEISNTGKRNLIILSSNSSCGCTVSEYPEDPLPPQSKSYVKVIFDSKGKRGVQEKKVSIFSNTIPNETIFVVEVEVIE